MKCPHCSFEQADGGAECLSCGLIFSKWKAAEAGSTTTSTSAAVPFSPRPLDAMAPAGPALLETPKGPQFAWVRPASLVCALVFGAASYLVGGGKSQAPSPLDPSALLAQAQTAMMPPPDPEAAPAAQAEAPPAPRPVVPTAPRGAGKADANWFVVRMGLGLLGSLSMSVFIALSRRN